VRCCASTARSRWAALIVETGRRAVRADDHAQRLAREALLLLVFDTRPAIKASLLRRLG